VCTCVLVVCVCACVCVRLPGVAFVLAPEVSTALTLVADLASSHVCVCMCMCVCVCVHWGRGVLCVYMCTCGVCVRACVYASQE